MGGKRCAQQRHQHVRSSSTFPFRGEVVPEIASRGPTVELIVPVIVQAIEQAGITEMRIDAIAADDRSRTDRPALLVGVAAAKSLALVWDVPFVGGQPSRGRTSTAGPASRIRPWEFPTRGAPRVGRPQRCSSRCGGPGRYRLLGETIDDAGRRGVSGQGGPGYLSASDTRVDRQIDREARVGDPEAIAFPRAIPGLRSSTFSFSGVKTRCDETTCAKHPRRSPRLIVVGGIVPDGRSSTSLVAKARRARPASGRGEGPLPSVVALRPTPPAAGAVDRGVRRAGRHSGPSSRAWRMCTDNAGD